MIRLFYLLTILIAGKFLSAQELKWVHQYGGTGEEITGGIAKDGEGNIYTTGFFTEESIFGTPEGGIHMTAGSFNDMYVAKASPEGELLWVKGFTAEVASGTAIAADIDGNVFVAGSFVGEIDLNPGGTPYVITSTGDSHDSFLLKLDTNGDFVWARSIGGLEYGAISSVVIDDYQTINVVGFFYDTFTFESTDGSIERTSRGSNDIFIAKYSQDGEIYWLHQFGGESLDLTISSATNIFSDLYVTGMFMEDAYLDDSLVMTIDESNANGIFLLKFNMMGEAMPMKIAEILESSENPSVGMTCNIAVDDDSNVYVCGDFNPIIEFLPKENGDIVRFEAVDNANPGGFVAKITQDGYLEWANYLVSNSAPSASVAYGIAVNSNQEVFLSGYAGGDVNFGSYQITNDIFHSYLAKLNSDGEFVYAHQFGTSYFVEASNSLILTDDDEHVYLVGTFQDDVDLSPSPTSSYEVTSRGFRDVFLVKMSVGNLGISENEFQPGYVRIYPNPSTGIYNLQSTKSLGASEYKVYDLTGRQVFSGKVNSSNQINLKLLPKGTYMLKVDGFASIKVIKN